MEQWSNQACLGYIIKGMQERGKSEEEIQEVVNAVRSQFDWTTIDEAAAVYTESYY